ncbi:MAG: hypothetical protein IJT94_08645 [Oscillibacter sp.]|nr:hypothetical protein [Oscillibacter sp.]
MSGRIINTNIRLNLDKDEDRRAWERLQRLDRSRYKSYSRAVVAALNDFFDRQERMETDSYLETREKENAFLQKVLDTIERGLRFAGGPDCQEHENTAELNTASAAFHAEPECAESDKERRETEESLLDFIDSF